MTEFIFILSALILSIGALYYYSSKMNKKALRIIGESSSFSQSDVRSSLIFLQEKKQWISPQLHADAVLFLGIRDDTLKRGETKNV